MQKTTNFVQQVQSEGSQLYMYNSVSASRKLFFSLASRIVFPIGPWRYVSLCFFERKKCNERALFSDKANFAQQICLSSGGREKYFNIHGTSLEQVLTHLENEKLWLFEKVDRKSSGFSPVRRDKLFLNHKRSRMTFFKPLHPNKKTVVQFLIPH